MLAGSISGSNGEMYIDLIKLVFAVVFGSASVFGLGLGEFHEICIQKIHSYHLNPIKPALFQLFRLNCIMPSYSPAEISEICRIF